MLWFSNKLIPSLVCNGFWVRRARDFVAHLDRIGMFGFKFWDGVLLGVKSKDTESRDLSFSCKFASLDEQLSMLYTNFSHAFIFKELLSCYYNTYNTYPPSLFKEVKFWYWLCEMLYHFSTVRGSDYGL